MKKVSNANPQQAGVTSWGKSELIEYINADGKELRAMLTKPENFDPAKKYPADGLHLRGADAGAAQLRARRTSAPASTSRATSATATSCCGPTSSTRPAIRARAPMKCVIPAVNTVVAHGLHRSEAHRHPGPLVGRLPDHLPDHADEHVRGGRSRRVGVEHDQRLRRHPLGHGHGRARSSTRRRRARIGAPPWDAPLQFIENSPIFWVEKHPHAVPDDPQRRGRRGAVVSGHRVQHARCAGSARKPTCSPSTASRTACATATT